jgi:hypothetical protein
VSIANGSWLCYSCLPQPCVLLRCCACAGHQLHYDSDDEGQGGVRNPIFTSVLYLAPNTATTRNTSSNTSEDAPNGAVSSSSSAKQQPEQQPFVGGPTLVTDQLLGGPLATKGWLAYPATNRFTMFDGKYLHGKNQEYPASMAVYRIAALAL